MKALVTGGAGFIGSHIVDRLVSRGIDVMVLDDLSTGQLENLVAVEDSIRFIEGDVRNPADVDEAIRGANVVLHLAALGSVPRSIEDPLTTHDVNATGTLNVLIAAMDHSVGRVVYASSSSVYGDTPTLPKTESMPTRPQSPYAVSKMTGEHYCRAFSASMGLSTVSLRYFNVFGPRQDPHSQYAAVIPLFAAAALRGADIEIHGDGLQTRDFTYIENVVDANIRAALADLDSGGHYLNVATGRNHSILSMAETILSLTPGSASAIKHMPARPGDVRDSLADLTSTAETLGYVPVVDFEEGMARTVDYLLATVAAGR